MKVATKVTAAVTGNTAQPADSKSRLLLTLVVSVSAFSP